MLSKYAKNREPKLHTAKVFATKLAIDIKKHELVLQKIHEIMETVYADLKGKQIYRNIQQNLGSKQTLFIMYKTPSHRKIVTKFPHVLGKIVQTYQPHPARTAAISSGK